MSEILEIISAMKGRCNCGTCHETAIQDIRIASGLVRQVGDILRENRFPDKLLLVADRSTLNAADGIEASLSAFTVTYKVFEDLRVAKMEQVEELKALISDPDMAILSVGTGSVNDICRLAAAARDTKLCIFATAPSMDGFASYSAPIVANGFKSSYPAKSPEVIIGDTRILADAPAHLKAAGFGDMIAKYIALADWKISHILTGEIYCEKVAALTRNAVDELVSIADRVATADEYTAGKIFEALLKTGIGMSFTKNSRPASGSEHMIAHLMECMELQEDIIPNLHGDDVGVSTLEMLRLYGEAAKLPAVTTQYECVDWEDVYRFYGPMQEEVRALNHPDNIIDGISPEKLRALWPQICEIINSVPSYAECRATMETAGCKITVADIGKSREFFDRCAKYSPFMRKRLTLMRLAGMIREFPAL